MKPIRYTKHLKTRIKLRNIQYQLPRKIYKEAAEHYFDIQTELKIALKPFQFSGKIRGVIVVYKENKAVKLITIHPLKKKQKADRIKRGRWIKI